ncbi:hypothetical protein KPE71_11255 [Acinetobacter soli]|uniref:hypothetical protein n=1 Tax=Acinetobacter soli TaxID=487316 RepID=UPI001C0D2213|nr:hypothetical protein [Acinetobacter soli]MBU3120829.1 hypothetical protein [Acinetobacter soli]
MKDVKIHSWLISLTILLALLAFWCFYPIFFQWLIVTQFNIDPVTYGKTFGAVGDTYGSLNTLISSLALAGVAYSAYLQVTSLKETRNATARQLELAEKNHKEQLNESKNSQFTNQFYALLNYKAETFRSLTIQNGQEVLTQNQIMKKFRNHFRTFIIQHSKDNIDDLTGKKIRSEFVSFSKQVNNNSFFELFSYFECYVSLINLINMYQLDKKKKFFYKRLIRQSMTPDEQIVLFLLAPMWDRVHDGLRKSEIFYSFYLNDYIKFSIKYYDESYFALTNCKEIFKKNMDQTPT